MARRKRLRGEGKARSAANGQGQLLGFRVDVGDRVRHLREERGWSQADLGERMKPPRSKMQVYRLEDGQVPSTLGMIEELAAALGTPERPVSMVEFLAPILGAEDARSLKETTRDHLAREVAEYERTRMEQWRRSVEREDVQRLLQDALNTAPLMTADQVMFLRELLWAWSQKLGRPRSMRPDLTESVMGEAEESRLTERIRRREGNDGEAR